MTVTDDIKARLDIVQFISQYVPLKKAGRNYTAPCPFHQERTPSFVVFPDTQGWHCFGACGEGGDIFNFVMKKEGLDFVGALRFLAEKAGVELQERTSDQIKQDERLDKLRGLLNEAATFFQKKLSSGAASKHARDYVQRRSINAETVDLFRIGYAPAGWDEAIDHLRLLGYSLEEVVEAGVAVTNEAGRTYDRFRNRLVIPIFDERGRIIGFGARALAAEDNPKYLNSPQTPLFDKSATLFGLHLARRAIRESEMAVIVEGYMDAIQAHQSGFNNVVAQMGTALTRPQLKQLSKYARRLVLALDPDVAGAKATMRGLDVVRQASETTQAFFDPAAMIRQASRLDIDIQVITMPEGKDPDELIRDDPQAWTRLIASATPVADYVIEAGTAHLPPNATLAEREQVARELVPILMATESSLQEYANVQKLAYKLRLGSGRELASWAQAQIRAVTTPMQPVTPPQDRQARPAEPARPAETATPDSTADRAARAARPGPPVAGGSVVERECLAMLIRQPELLSSVNRRLRLLASQWAQAHDALGPLSIDDFTQSDLRAVFDTLQRALGQDEQDVNDYLTARLPFELREVLERLRAEPVEGFEQRLSQPLRPDLRGFLKVRTPEERLEPRALELRKQRLRRENMDLQFLQQSADAEMDRTYGQRLLINKTAISAIDSEIRRGPFRG
ncbi:MAG: DNA primase [Anaerolineae bacterium]|nr:DNA primase [Anaerolineae bacterium]